ncbi:MAG: cysteine--tRNA ligase [Planctomycetota bacterium]
MALRVYNTLTNTKETFEPVRPGHVGMYLCGPTVYKPSHIGHAVSPILFDTIKRYLLHKGFDVTLVINITDVDDKLIAESAAQGSSMAELAERVMTNYFECLDALGVRNVDAFPKATENIGNIIALVQRLVDKGAAYVVDGDVYFDHTKAADYGKLSGRKVEDALAGTREVASKSRHPADFALWKAAGDDEPAWNSPWGPGRPGWHIECSAMSMAILGETFDIHGGGVDLIFPHHENEIAQSEAATGKPFARYWLHNGLTRIRTKAAGGEWTDEKMSKSLGNIRTISDLLAAYSPETIRMFVLSTHYRRPLDFSDEQLANTEKAAGTFYRLFERIARTTGEDVYTSGDTLNRVRDQAVAESQQQFVNHVMASRVRLYDAMDDDFNTAGAIAALHELAGLINRYIDASRLEGEGKSGDKALVAAAGRELIASGRLLGLFEAPPPAAATGGLESDLMELLIDLRTQARRAKNFAMADQIRDRLSELGITLADTPGGTVWRKES